MLNAMGYLIPTGYEALPEWMRTQEGLESTMQNWSISDLRVNLDSGLLSLKSSTDRNSPEEIIFWQNVVDTERRMLAIKTASIPSTPSIPFHWPPSPYVPWEEPLPPSTSYKQIEGPNIPSCIPIPGYTSQSGLYVFVQGNTPPNKDLGVCEKLPEKTEKGNHVSPIMLVGLALIGLLILKK